MENLIKNEVSEILNVSSEDVVIDHRLMGGMSNYTYVICVNGKKYTFRIPGKNADAFVDRAIEKKNIELVDQLNVNNKTDYLDIEKGYKLADYIEGTPLHELTPEDYLSEVSTVLHKIHDSKLIFENNYDALSRLDKYQKLVEDYNYKHSDKYFKLLDEFLTYRKFIELTPKLLCHGDSQPSNFVVAENKLYLLDWEFAGNNDPLYDIAAFGNKDFELALKLIDVYFGRKATNDELKRLYLWRAFQCLQWHNVALYKEFIGLSEELKIDFKWVADMYLTKADNFLGEAKKYN